MRRVTVAAITGAALMLAAGCSSSSAGPTSSGSGSGNADPAPVTVRLGFLENITHASALVGLKEGFFTKALGSAGTLKPTAFSTGTQETTAILAGQLDAAYVGPNPAINAWQKSGGTAIKIVSGAATGGASVVVAKGITSAAQLKGKTLATPSLGNTQDVALRYWLKQNGLTTTSTGGGDAFVKPTTPNSAAVLEFKSGQIAGGSEPAPYDIEMVSAGGTVLVSEPGVTTLLVVTQSFLSAHPAIVADLIKAQIQANDFIKSNPTAAEADANAELASYTDKPLKSSLVAASFKEITFTDDPDES
ncbi:MAG TPA: ABC transporter substrate-binding protein, partial [Streptosporangiaceae bacterium]|nr:ABC transporter substrate-binding protein [Streptosporangiaceae bacterium]